MARAAVVLSISLLLGGAGALRAQSARDLVTQGVRAYRALEYDAAVGLLQRSLADDAAGALSAAERAQALSYLGATQLFCGQRDSATAAFSEIVLLDPRYRPDELVFPPQVTNLFQEVRRSTKAIAVVVPPATELRLRLDRFSTRVLTSALADVTVTLGRDDGTPVRELYSGPVADSLVVTWDGLTAAGTPPEEGRYVLRVAPRGAAAAAPRAVQVTLDIKPQAPDTVPWPERPTTPLLLPERTGGGRGPALRALAAGLVTGAAALVLPSVVGRSGPPTDARFAVAAAAGGAGLFGFLGQRGTPIDANIRANTATREAWQRRVSAVRAENATRRDTGRLVIHAGPPTIAERAAQ